LALAYSKEAIKEFALRRLRLTPETLGKNRHDVPVVVSDVGGLQYGGHKIELLNRFQSFKEEWFDHWYRNHVLMEGHVLRAALRIVCADEYPYYFRATRSVARRRKYQRCPSSITGRHLLALKYISDHGPLSPAEFETQLGTEHPELKRMANTLIYDLYNHGEIARVGRKKERPSFHAMEKLPLKREMIRVREKEAREWLLLKCLSIYGPFSAKDIAHWVGWNISETNETIDTLSERKAIVKVLVEDSRDSCYLRARDVPLLDSLGKDIPENSFVRVLFNDDALLLGFYRRLESLFGYDWRYPQFSEGVAWRAAILCGRQIIGEAVIEMYAHSDSLRVKSMILRRHLVTPRILSDIKDQFIMHSEFQRKRLVMRHLVI